MGERGWFDRPVVVNLEPGIRDHVGNAAQAADILLNRWPAKPGPSHLEARRACAAVLTGLREGRAAREAFARAAVEAGILDEAAPPAPPPASEGPKLWKKQRYTLKRAR